MPKRKIAELDPVEAFVLRLQRNTYLGFLLLSLVAAWLTPTQHRWLWLIMSLVAALGLLHVYMPMTQRVVGWSLAALGLIVSAFAIFASPQALASFMPSAKLASHELALVVAEHLQTVGGGLIGIGIYLVLTITQGQISPAVERTAGLVGLICGLAFAAMLLIWPAGFEIGPLTFVALALIGYAADVTSKKWRNRIAAVAAVAAALLIANQLQPAWQNRVGRDAVMSWDFLTGHTHHYMFWPVAFAGFATVLRWLKYRQPWQLSLAASLFVMIAVWLFLIWVVAMGANLAGTTH